LRLAKGCLETGQQLTFTQVLHAPFEKPARSNSPGA
jgi:hypothetical protein